MQRILRGSGMSLVALAAVLTLAGSGIAGVLAGDVDPGSPPEETIQSPPAPEESSPADEDAESSPATESANGSDKENHGQCVSHWVHAAKDAGLSGRDFGAFVSAVARSDGTGTGETCDLQTALDEALATAASDAPAASSEGRANAKGGPHATDD